MRGSIVAAGLRYFISLIAFVSLHYLPSFSQQESYARLNLSTRIRPVQTTLSFENDLFFNSKVSSTSFADRTEQVVSPDCGTAADISLNHTTQGGTGSTGLTDSELSFDNNMNTYSKLFIDNHNKDVDIVQWVAFTTTSTVSDVVKLYLSSNKDLDQHFELSAQAYYYNASTLTTTGVGTPLSFSGLPIVTSSAAATPKELVFSPNAIFNRVKITIFKKDNSQYNAQLQLHQVQLTPPPPSTPDATNGGESAFTDCAGPISLAVSNPSASYSYKWYTFANVEISNGGISTYTPTLATGTHIFYVTATKVGCTEESPKHKITVTVNPPPPTPAIALN
jgi:hypothetical protein